MPIRNCVICNSSNHNRRCCPVLQRFTNQIIVDNIPEYANDLEVQLEPQEPQEYNIFEDILYRPSTISNINTYTHKWNINFINETNQNTTDFECSICYELIIQTSNNCCKLNCNHNFCFNCISTQLKQTNNQNNQICCALCRQVVNDIYSFKSEEFKKLYN